MTDQKPKNEPPLRLDMDFAEALERFVRTDPEEAQAVTDVSKGKKTAAQRNLEAAAKEDPQKVVKLPRKLSAKAVKKLLKG